LNESGSSDESEFNDDIKLFPDSNSSDEEDKMNNND